MNVRTAMIALAATAMVGTQTLAAEVAPLTAGKPAGVHQAQAAGSPNLLILLGAGALVVGGIVIAMAADDYKPCAPTVCTASDNNTGAVSTGTK